MCLGHSRKPACHGHLPASLHAMPASLKGVTPLSSGPCLPVCPVALARATLPQRTHVSIGRMLPWSLSNTPQASHLMPHARTHARKHAHTCTHARTVSLH